ncbi:hypothetical protein [Mycobacterium sp. E2479]|uniref:hypothetical protein n=1 Tax=Mycobacterium sp. E2479 TaxID=1834134 RepID=UPI001E4BB33B|nr:hypothetical protein [Mycobacterium sp. E2479]
MPYLITVGVPVTVHAGMDTELYADRDGSPNSAPGFINRFGLITTAADTLGAVNADRTSRAAPAAAPATRPS